MIIGCGTGRCGSKSLAGLLEINHELKPLLPWYYRESLYEKKWKQLLKEGGDVSMSYLNYLPKFIEDHNAKVVCMMRDKQETIDSFMRKSARNNHWMNHDGERWEYDPVFDDVFPTMEADSKRDAIADYWDLYYDRAEKLLKKYPDNIAIFNIETLNSKKGQDKIFNFAEIPEDQRNYKVGIKLNKS